VWHTGFEIQKIVHCYPPLFLFNVIVCLRVSLLLYVSSPDFVTESPCSLCHCTWGQRKIVDPLAEMKRLKGVFLSCRASQAAPAASAASWWLSPTTYTRPRTGKSSSSQIVNPPLRCGPHTGTAEARSMAYGCCKVVALQRDRKDRRE